MVSISAFFTVVSAAEGISMLDLRHLRSFYQAAKSLSFSKAAENLCVSQPAVTAHIKLFEDGCNLKLFRREHGRVYLTDEGKKLFGFASKIFEIEHQLESVIDGLQKMKQGYLTIGTTKNIAKKFMPDLFRAFRCLHPEVIIELDEGSSLEIAKSVLNFRNSLGLIAKVEEYPEIVFTPFGYEEVILIVSPNHPLTERPRISFKDLAEEPIIMKEIGSGTNRLVQNCFRKENVTPKILAKTSNMEFIKDLVKRQDAVSFVVRSSVEQELADSELVSIPIKNHEMMLTVFIVHLKTFDLPSPAAKFLDFLKLPSDDEDLAMELNPITEKIWEIIRARSKI